jgi:RNA polymerase sigma factor (sigma-70 family)
MEEVVRDCHAEYRWLMYKVIRAMPVGQEDTEDVIQDILLRWTRQLEGGRNLPAPEALTEWFRTVARHAAIARLRRLRGKYREAEDAYGRRRLAAEERAPHSELTAKELPEVIRLILTSNVTSEMRLVLELWGQGLTYSEIAERVNGRNAEAVRNAIRKVRVLLREELTRLGWSIP